MRQFHACYSVGDDRLWGVVRPRKGADFSLAAIKSCRCRRTEGVQVHQVRKLADLARPGQPPEPQWVSIMARRRRKTLVVCGACHASIHQGQPVATFKE